MSVPEIVLTVTVLLLVIVSVCFILGGWWGLVISMVLTLPIEAYFLWRAYKAPGELEKDWSQIVLFH